MPRGVPGERDLCQERRRACPATASSPNADACPVKSCRESSGFSQQRQRAGMQRVERGDEVAAVDRRNETDSPRAARRSGCRTSCKDGRGVSPGARSWPGFCCVSSTNSGAVRKPNLARRLARIEQQADVGGRDARGFGLILFLHVVGDQVIVALARRTRRSSARCAARGYAEKPCRRRSGACSARAAACSARW